MKDVERRCAGRGGWKETKTELPHCQVAFGP